jgi:hypothetical protein
MENINRPLGAKILTALATLNGFLYIGGGLLSGNLIFGLVLGFLLLGIAYALWIGKNWAWSLMVISTVLNILGASSLITKNSPIEVTNLSQAIFGIIGILILFKKDTKGFYNTEASGRNQLSIGGTGFKIFVGIFILIAALLAFMAFGIK